MLRPCPHLCRYFGKSFWVEIFRNSLDKKNGDVILQHHMCLTLPPFLKSDCSVILFVIFWWTSIFIRVALCRHPLLLSCSSKSITFCVCVLCVERVIVQNKKKNPHICVDIAYFPKNQDTGASTANVSLLSNLSCFVWAQYSGLCVVLHYSASLILLFLLFNRLVHYVSVSFPKQI